MALILTFEILYAVLLALDFSNYLIFSLKKVTGKKRTGLDIGLENFLKLLHLKEFSYYCLRNSEM